MTFEEKLAAKVAEAQVERETQQDRYVEEALTNPAFIETQRAITAKESEIQKLEAILKQLNAIPAFVANDGTKYSVNVYPISFFGATLGRLLGIVSGVRSAFTDDLALSYRAITGLSLVELEEAADALGRPAYFSKDGTYVDAVPGNPEKLRLLLGSIALKLGLFELNLNDITAEKIDLYFTKGELTALKKKSEWDKNLALNATTNFTMED